MLHRLFGLPTYSVYDDDDPVAERIGPELVGYRPKPSDREQMASSPEVFFVKTHKRPKSDDCPAIYIVRDGRDAIVSQARQRAESCDDRDCSRSSFEQFVREAILRPWNPLEPSSGSWGGNVLSWLDRPIGRTVVIRYEELIADPLGVAARAVSAFHPDLIVQQNVMLPSFAELHDIDPRFFRRGINGAFRDELSPELQNLFWQQQENVIAMERLGYRKGTPPVTVNR